MMLLAEEESSASSAMAPCYPSLGHQVEGDEEHCSVLYGHCSRSDRLAPDDYVKSTKKAKLDDNEPVSPVAQLDFMAAKSIEVSNWLILF